MCLPSPIIGSITQTQLTMNILALGVWLLWPIMKSNSPEKKRAQRSFDNDKILSVGEEIMFEYRCIHRQMMVGRKGGG